MLDVIAPTKKAWLLPCPKALAKIAVKQDKQVEKTWFMTSKRNQPVCMTSTPILHGFSYASPRNENQRLTCAMYISAGAAPSSAGAAPSSTPPQFGASNLPSPVQKRGSQFHLLAARLEDDEDRVKMEALQTPSPKNKVCCKTFGKHTGNTFECV